MSQSEDYCFFKERLPELLKKHREEYVLISDKKEHGFFKSVEDAAGEGYEQFGSGNFIVQKITDVIIRRGT